MSKDDKIIIITNKIERNYKDAYFGKIEKLFQTNNYIKLWRVFSKASAPVKKRNINIAKNLSFFDNVACVKEAISFKFFNKYSNVFNSLSTLKIYSHFKLVYQIIKYVKIYNPKFIFFTLEGHLWENLLIEKCKKISGQKILIGYQFTKINYKSNIFKTLYKQPDYIFCSGNIDKLLLKKKFNSEKLHILGSPKYQISIKKNFQKKIDFLILPNANKKYLSFLIDFFIKFNYLNKEKKLKFLIRNHPLMSKQNLEIIKKKIFLYKNFKISNSTLKEDLKKSRFLVFDETTISLYSYKYKTVPLYFDYSKTKNLNMDYNFPSDLIIKNHQNLQKIFQKKLSKKTKNYLNYVADNYFLKMRKINLNHLTND